MTGALRAREWLESLRIYADRRVIAILFLGFSSGLPIMLIATTLSTWLREEGVSRSAIGLFGLVFVPYTLKFIWAPLIDRMPLPPLTGMLGRRRGWMLLTQICLIAVIWGLGRTDPGGELYWVAFMAVCVAFFSASQDVVIDAYRIDSLPKEELGAGAGVVVLGYRIAMWVATAGALLIADQSGWSTAYAAMALLMLVGIGTTLLVPEPESSGRDLAKIEREQRSQLVDKLSAKDHRAYVGIGGSLGLIIFCLLLVEPLSVAWGVFGGFNSAITSGLGSIILLGNLSLATFAVMVAALLIQRRSDAPWYAKTFCMITIGWLFVELLAYATTDQGYYLGKIYAWALLAVIWACSDLVVGLFGYAIDYDSVVSEGWILATGLWIKLLATVYIYAFFYFAKRSIANFGLPQVEDESRTHLWVRRAIVDPYADFFVRNGAYAAFVILALISVFKASDAVLTLMANPFYIDVGFSKAQIAWVSKTFGLWMTLLGGLVGGILAHRLGMMRAMVVATIAMAISNLMFAMVANVGHESLAITEAAILENRDLTDAEIAARAVVGSSILPYFYALIIIENLAGGIGTAIFVAFLSALCNLNYSATQYALVTSFMQMFAKFVIVPSSGVYADALGWQWFFITSTMFMIPALILLGVLYRMGMGVEGRLDRDPALQAA